MSWLFPVESHSSGGFLIFVEKPFFRWIPCLWVVIPSRITISPVEWECWQSTDEKSPEWYQVQDSLLFRTFTTEEFKKKFKLENVINMKNKHYPATNFIHIYPKK
jgi:hypothetical protein